jgi:hypothetical protein
LCFCPIRHVPIEKQHRFLISGKQLLGIAGPDFVLPESISDEFWLGINELLPARTFKRKDFKLKKAIEF